LEVVKAVSFYGYNNKELADVFHISEKTVKNHLANIMRKTDTRSTRELLALILRASLVSIFQPGESKWGAFESNFPI
jgi:DNA-binding NarL/FixJ family response regulator